MIPVYQTRYGPRKRDKDLGGNCFQAALASILELTLEEVPDFCNIYSIETEEWYSQYITWLNKKGLTSLTFALTKDWNLKHLNLKDCYLLVTGKNKNGVNHCVIYRNAQPIHNPNRKCGGIKPETVDIIFPLNPCGG